MLDLNQSYWSVLIPLSENTTVVKSAVPPLTSSSAVTVVAKIKIWECRGQILNCLMQGCLRTQAFPVYASVTARARAECNCVWAAGDSGNSRHARTGRACSSKPRFKTKTRMSSLTLLEKRWLTRRGLGSSVL